MTTPPNFNVINKTPKYPLFILLILVVVFFGRDAIPSKGSFIGGLDILSMVYDRMLFSKTQLLSGSIPLWNPYICGGIPMTPNGTFYPTFLLFLVLPLPWAFNIDIMIHIYLAAAGMYCFIFLITGSKKAGITAGIVYCFGGYPMSRIMIGHQSYLYSLALLPWIFFFMEKAFIRKKPVLFLLPGLILGLAVLGNVDQNAFYISFFLTIYFTIRCVISKITSFRIWSGYLFIPLVSFGISAIQLIPFLEFLSQSDRAAKSYDFATFMSFPLGNFYTFLIRNPDTLLLYLDREFNGYIGILAIILAINGLIFSPFRMYKRIVIIICIIAITFMLGSYTPIYQVYYNFFPFIGSVRIPARCLIIFIFSISILTGLGVQQLLHSSQSLKQYVSISFITPIILLIALLVGAQTFEISLASSEMRISICLLISAAALLTINRFLANTQIASALIIAFLFLNLFYFYKPLLPKRNENKILEQRAYEKRFKNDSEYYRVILPFLFGDSRAMHHHYFDANGYTFMFLNDYFKFVHEMAGLPEDPYNRHHLNPELFSKDRIFSSKILNIKYGIARTPQGWGLFQANDVFPRAIMIHDAIFLSDKNAHLSYLKNDRFNPQSHVLFLDSDKERIESYVTTRPKQAGKESTVEIDAYFPNRIELHSVSHQDGYLLLSEIFYPGWQAYVDGKRVPIFRADYLLRAVPLTAGHHNIIFVYRPMSFILGAAISVATMVVLLVFFLFISRRMHQAQGVFKITENENAGVLKMTD